MIPSMGMLTLEEVRTERNIIAIHLETGMTDVIAEYDEEARVVKFARGDVFTWKDGAFFRTSIVALGLFRVLVEETERLCSRAIQAALDSRLVDEIPPDAFSILIGGALFATARAVDAGMRESFPEDFGEVGEQEAAPETAAAPEADETK